MFDEKAENVSPFVPSPFWTDDGPSQPVDVALVVKIHSQLGRASPEVAARAIRNNLPAINFY